MIRKPKSDPVIEEIHAVRREISDRFGGNVHAIAADANARMLASGCTIWRQADSNPLPRSGDGTELETDDLTAPPAGR